MYAVTRFYSGPGARELFDLLAENTGSVEEAIRSVPGFVGYTLLRSGDGGTSVTVCTDKAGADESSARAAAWVKEHAPTLKTEPPGIAEGEVILNLP